MAFGAFVATALFSLVPFEQSQAQLMLSINPLQGDTNNTTLWTFSGSSIPELSSSIAPQSDNSNHSGSQGSLYPFSSSGAQFLTTSAPSRYNTTTNYSLTANSNSTPQISTPFGTRTISHIRLQNNASSDTLGFRVAGTTSLGYTNGVSLSWSGQGTLPHPVSDFTLTAANQYFYGALPFVEGYVNGSINIPISFGLRVIVSSAPRALIPEPEEYALVSGLLALGFVFFRHRRHFQKNKQQAQATAS